MSGMQTGELVVVPRNPNAGPVDVGIETGMHLVMIQIIRIELRMVQSVVCSDDGSVDW